MQTRIALVASVTVALLLSTGLPVHSQGLMGGFKGHHHRGTGAVELLLATGILAKLLNHHKRGGIGAQRIMHALLGGHRYAPRFPARYPVEGTPLLQEDLVEPHASMAIPFTDTDLMLHEESALLGAKSPFFIAPRIPMFTEGQLLAASEAQISQQLLAARQARKILAAREARKLLAAQETRQILAAQREARHLLAAQEANALLSAANPSARHILQAGGSSISTSSRQPDARQVVSSQSAESRQLLGSLLNAEGHRLGVVSSRADAGEFYTIQHQPDQLLDETLLLNLHRII